MDIKQILGDENEKPLDRLVTDGGFCGVLRTIACVGDSLASGELECVDKQGNRTYHDIFDISWGQYMARLSGNKVYNFSRGGMTAKEYIESFAELNGFWDEDKKCQAYVIGLGVNDLGQNMELGSTDDIDLNDYRNNKPTFAGFYGAIIQRYKQLQPKAKFFLITIPRNSDRSKEDEAVRDKHAELLYEMAKFFDFTYVIDLRKYELDHNREYEKQFCLEGHLNPAGYLLAGKAIASYIDYIIRHNMKDFCQTAFIGTSQYMEDKE